MEQSRRFWKAMRGVSSPRMMVPHSVKPRRTMAERMVVLLSWVSTRRTGQRESAQSAQKPMTPRSFPEEARRWMTP